ncbi:helix-turn-helix domain-containing protein [Carnobacterium divergens]|uniref:helix-turn-helix domain-containing protein n=1 Tax=Carnobacterium divergens TaxID=2748 RepID=UPI00288E7F2E|nr:helix-turn-helix transcriptional regulator [Carnobacterium divergens]MDT2010834.1 helix-turn-helix domain-containing protein [Carnobacterium divergens]
MQLGDKIQYFRKKKLMSQFELAQDICTQATISNIENNNTTPNIFILEKLAKRLDISLDQLSDDDDEDNQNQIFKKISKLIELNEHKKAFFLIQEKLDKNNILVSDEKKYYYYLGITHLIGFNKIELARENFEKVFISKSELSIEDVLTLVGLGISYVKTDEVDVAKTYFDKALNLLKLIKKLDRSGILEFAKIYYNSAKFFSLIKDYYRAINLCEIAIDLVLRQDSRYHLAYLYYEYAFNLVQLGHNDISSEYYQIAYSLACIDNIEVVRIGVIQDIKQFGIKMLNLSTDIK